jgi:membrane fusion protein (multidrug efflux system)
LFAAGLALLIALTVFVISRDEGYTYRVNPQTDNAYVGGDVTQISAREQGYLTNLPIADNQVVHAGDLIAAIEDDDYRAERDQAQASLQAARARLAALDAQQTELTAEIARSRSFEASSIAATGRTSPELARQEIIVHTDAGVRRALEEAQADQKRDSASVAASHAQLQVRERQEATLEAQLRAATAAVAARQADLDLASLNLGWTRIVAPVDGTLGARLVRVGDLMAAGTHVISITPLDTVWVDANFTERQMPNVRVGQRARLRLDTFPRDILAGRVVGISPVTGGRLAVVQPDNTTGNFTKVPARVPVRIAILWDDSGAAARLRGLVRPGMSAVVTVLTEGGD